MHSTPNPTIYEVKMQPEATMDDRGRREDRWSAAGYRCGRYNTRLGYRVVVMYVIVMTVCGG